MAVLQIITYPHPSLRKVSAGVGCVGGRVAGLMRDLVETVRSFPGCVGIAAPQTDNLVRVIVVDVSARKCPNNGLIVLADPEIVHRDGARTGREGCLSLPDFIGRVRRSERIVTRGLDTNGDVVEIRSMGFEAVAVQHEVDHLDGVLFIDRVSSLKTDVFRRESDR